MINDYRFFQDFYDGQIVKKESEKFKLVKLLLVSCFSVVGLFFVLLGTCNWAEFILFELGMIWNFYLGLGKRVSLVLCFIVGMIYFFFACNFGLYANGLIYIACYIPFQLIATTKDYEEGDFIQIKKGITDWNKILFIIFFAVLCVSLCLFDVANGSRFIIFDGLSASLLICSAILRNERYFEYYVFRIFALVMSIVLWIMVALEYGLTGSLLIILMYFAYLIFDIINYFVQNKTYVNEYMVQSEKYTKIENVKIVEEKLKVYRKSEKSKSGNKVK